MKIKLKNRINMAKQNVEELEARGTVINKTEFFLENHGKKVIYFLIAVLAISLAIYGYYALITEPRNLKAAEMMSQAQTRFGGQTPDFELALLGDANGAGFINVIEEYGSTPSGNLAQHYAGICYLRQGDLVNAAKYLANYSSVSGIPGAIINAQNIGIQGDIAVENKEYGVAVKFFNKAVKASDNMLTAPLYLRKAGLAEMALGNKEAADGYFQEILNSYPASYDAREAEKLIGSNQK